MKCLFHRLSDVKNLVHQLYEALNVEEHQIQKERELHKTLEQLKCEIEPMELVSFSYLFIYFF